MPAFVRAPASQSAESFTSEIENAWKSVVCNSPREQHAKPNFDVHAHVDVFRGPSLDMTRGWPGAGDPREFAYKAPPGVSNATTKPVRMGRGRNLRVRGPIGLSTMAPTSLTEGTLRNDSSSSSDEDQIYGVNRISRQCGRTGGRKLIRIVSGPSQKVEHAASRSEDQNADPSHSGPADAPTKQAGGRSSRGMAASKSESHISTATRKRMLCLPRVKHGSDRDDFPQKTPSKKRESSLPPLGGGKTALQNEITREIEDQLANLRASPRERQALEDRLSHHRSKDSKHRTHRDGPNPNPNPNPSGEGDITVCSNDSVGSLSSDGDLTQGRNQCGTNYRPRKGRRWRRRRRLSASTKAAEASGRVLAQALHAQGVVRRKREIDEERLTQLRDRSALMAAKARQRRDRAKGKTMVEGLAVIVACATRFATWRERFLLEKKARLQAEMAEASAAKIQRAWCRSHLRRTWAGVRASAPGVQSTVLAMRQRAAAAREAVEKRRMTQAADLIRLALKAGTRTLFRTRITYYREKIVSCQRHLTTFREVSKARTKLLAGKWARLVQTLDGARFSTYSQHLRDMYNFDPAAVEQFLKEMRTLATNGHNAAYGMRAKIGLKGLINGIAVSPRAECAPATSTSSENPERENVLGVDGDGDGEGGPVVEERSRRPQQSRLKQKAEEKRTESSNTDGKKKRGGKRGKAKLASGWQKRVTHTHSDVEAQAALMCKRGLKHKEISRALRSALIDDLLAQARRVHKDWCWNALRKAREKKGQNTPVNLRDIRSALGTSCSSTGEGMMDASHEGSNGKHGREVRFGKQQGMLLLTMVTDDILMRCIILAERIEACVAADSAGRGSLSPDELRDIFVVNRHPAQHENIAAKEIKAELQVWAKRRGISAPVIRRASAGKTASYYAHQLQQLSPTRQEASRVEQVVPYFDFMGVVKEGILSGICVPEEQRLAYGEEGETHGLSAIHSKGTHLPSID